MQFPRLLLPRIAVWRTPSDLHVGGPHSSLVLSSVPSELADAVESLDGSHSLDDLHKICDQEWVMWLLAVLDSHGLLAEGQDGPRRVNVTVHGTGILATRVSALLAASSRAQIVERNGYSFDPTTLHLVVPSTAEADRVLIADLEKQRCPHLIVRADERTATVGPFVIPEVTSCLTCSDLARRDVDPTWPVQVFQLSRVETHPESWLCSWASATAVAHAMVYAHGLMPESASTTIEMSAWDGRVTYRGWPKHPQCPWHGGDEGDAE